MGCPLLYTIAAAAAPRLAASVPGLRFMRMHCSRGSECFFPLGLRQFTNNLQVIRQVRALLQTTPWSPTVEQELGRLIVGNSIPIITQVLRCDLPTDTTLSFFNWAKHLEGIQKFDTYGLLVGRLRKTGRLLDIVALLEELRHCDFEKTAPNFNCLLAHYWREQQIDGALNVWQQMKDAGIVPSSCAYDRIIDLYLRTKRATDAAMFFSQMLRDGCIPTADTYTLFIKYFAEIGRPDVAHTIFTKLPIFKVRRSIALLLIVLSAYARAGNETSAKTLAREIRESGAYPMEEIERTLHELTKAGEIEKPELLAVQIWSELITATKLKTCGSTIVASNEEEEPLFPQDEVNSVERVEIDYDPCINPDHLARALTPWTLDTVLCLEDARLNWTSQLVSHVLKRIREKDIAWNFFNWLEQQSRFKHDCLTLSQMILLFASYKDVSTLRQLLNKAKQEHIHLSSRAVEAAITVFAKSATSEEAIKTFRAIKRFGTEPNINIYKSIIHVLVQERRCMKAKYYFEQMVKAGLQPTLAIFSLLIRCFGKAGMTHIAHSVFEQIQETGQRPDANAYAFLIRANFAVGKVDVAMKLFEDLQASGVKPTSVLIEAMIKGLKNMSMQEQALDLETKYKSLISPWRRNKLDAEETKQIHNFLLKNLAELDFSELASHG